MAERKKIVAAANAVGHYVRGKTRGGSEIRIYSDEAGGDFPIHGAWWYAAETRWVPQTWKEDGTVIGKETPRSLDLNIKSLKF